MTTLTEMKDRLVEAARAQGASYSGDEPQPLLGYVTTMGVYASLVAAIAGAAKLSGRDIPDGFSPTEVVLCAAATHKLSRLLTKDPVTSPLRAPFTRFEGQAGAAELKEDVRGQGGKKAVGELMTCPFCAEVWVATGMAAGLIFLPRLTRTAMGVLAALAGADILQFVHAWLEKESSG